MHVPNTFLLCGHTLPQGHLTNEHKEVCKTGPLNTPFWKEYGLMRPHPSLRFCMQLPVDGLMGEGQKKVKERKEKSHENGRMSSWVQGKGKHK